MAGKDDDFDEWLDDIDASDGELDQSNIDELFSAADTAAKKPEVQDPGAKTSGELDQTNIDALLGLNSTASASEASGDADGASAELDQDNIDSLFAGTGYDAESGDDFSLDELDQNNIDALLAGSDDLGASGSDEEIADLAQDNIDALLADSGTKAAPADEESQGELDQNDIDSLLSTDVSAPTPPEDNDLDALFAADSSEGAAADADDFDELDQDNIDALFNDIDAGASTAPPEAEESLDQLFASDEGEATVAAPGPGAEELSTEDSEDIAASAFDSDLDDMDKLFAEMDDDIDDEDPFLSEEIDFAEMLGQTGGDDQEFIELEAADTKGAASKTDDFMAQAGAEDDSDVVPLSGDTEKTKKSAGLMLPAALANLNKTILAGVGSGLTLLLLIGLYFLFASPPKSTEEETREASIPATIQTPAPKMAANTVPTTRDARYDMGSEGGELAIELTATDEDDQPLIYEITNQPSHGRLSGTAPLLTYLPDNTFPGEDRFEFKVSDGTDTSKSAQVTITGPDLATLAMAKKETIKPEKKEEAAKKIFQPKKPKVLAKDVTYLAKSTDAVTIDWARLWQEANTSPYAAKEVHVEIIDTALKGALARGDHSNHIFTPDPYAAHSNTIQYRFKKGGFRSAPKTVTINVELGSPAPELNIAKLADSGYMVGQNVIIDASASRDEARESLRFSWEQLAGVPIDLHPVNEEGSKIAFTMPSSFYSDPNPGPTIIVTAVDNSGKEVQQEIKVKMVSRRQTALWRGENGSIAEEPPMQGRYFPWPFDD